MASPSPPPVRRDAQLASPHPPLPLAATTTSNTTTPPPPPQQQQQQPPCAPPTHDTQHEEPIGREDFAPAGGSGAGRPPSPRPAAVAASSSPGNADAFARNAGFSAPHTSQHDGDANGLLARDVGVDTAPPLSQHDGVASGFPMQHTTTVSLPPAQHAGTSSSPPLTQHASTSPPPLTEHDNSSSPPPLQPRKPSEAGLSLQTNVEPPPDDSVTFSVPPDAYSDRKKHRPVPLEPSGPRHAQKKSFGSAASSPTSSVSSPALAALGDVTPLPSPINATYPSDILWKKASSRPHSSSSASLERERASGGSFLTPTLSASSPGKKKVYPNLGTATPPLNPVSHHHHDHRGSHEHNRSISEFVPDPLQNVRPRTVTGPSVVTPPPKMSADHSPHELDTIVPLHREAYLARERGSVDPMPHDATRSLPSPPPSNRGASDEEDAARKTDRQLPPLTIKDHMTGKSMLWQPLRILGTGSFSEVFLASHTDMDRSQGSPERSGAPLVAIKVVSHHSGNDEARMDTSIKREIEILRSMKHPCLPQLYGFEDNDTRALLVMNYCAGGDLFELASQHRHLLRPSLIQRIFAELVGAILYLHSQYIVHRDIKLENILLNLSLPSLASLPTDPQHHPHPLVTLTDLGLAKHIPRPPASPLLTHPCGSVDYAAPEILLGQPYDGRATDAWALGVLLYALMEGRLPFDPLPEYTADVSGGGHRGHRSARGRGSTVKHRIARCDWLWCELGDDDGDWIGGLSVRGRELGGARECVEGLLKKVGRGRWSLERVGAVGWVKGGIGVDLATSSSFSAA